MKENSLKLTQDHINFCFVPVSLQQMLMYRFKGEGYQRKEEQSTGVHCHIPQASSSMI